MGIRDDLDMTPKPGGMTEPISDEVNHPAHYTTGNIEVIDFIEDQQLGFHEGNVVKYICRARHKGTELTDLEKAAWYLNRRIEQLREARDEARGY